MNLLHVDSSILGDNSVSRVLSKAIADRIVSGEPGIHLSYRDLAAEPIAHLTGRYLAGQSVDVQHDQAMQEDLALGGKVLEEFLASDVVVIGVALYNFTIPSQLKAWIDRILVAGKTFHYTETGPKGLATDKNVFLAIARGGFYGEGSPMASFEHAETYMRTALGFIGITNPTVVVAEGLAVSAEQREASMSAALASIRKIEPN